jgi:hypothetical protein
VEPVEGIADAEPDGVEALLPGFEEVPLVHATVTTNIETTNAAAVRR